MLDGLGDGFKTGKMNDEIERRLVEDAVESFGVEEVDFVEFRFFAGDLLDFVEDFDLTIGKIVEDFDCMALI